MDRDPPHSKGFTGLHPFFLTFDRPLDSRSPRDDETMFDLTPFAVTSNRSSDTTRITEVKKETTDDD
jgi:hypothetical protein